ncbi:hypothetical protein BMW24_007195 [Mycobacterium heckeshornense]|nr:hypothetical protein ACT16_21595 [Mycobacterium heckeshornense]PIJ35586.1 hypothetical protein BMW24_007195 [Mycobacterium heckeshornense]
MIPGSRRAPRYSSGVARRIRPRPCRWCGRDIAENGTGRRRLYCRQSCRQRAYEQRALTGGARPLPADAVVLSAREAVELADRVYQVRCAAEDVATALDEGAERAELRRLCDTLLRAVHAVDGWR